MLNLREFCRNNQGGIKMKVRCAECKNQVNSWCTPKKTKISLNKKRTCGEYMFDETKVRAKHDIPTTYRSEWVHKKKELKKLIKQQAEEQKKQEEMAKQAVEKPPNYLKAPGTGNPKHPLTGDLSRFTSTSSRGKENGK